MTSVLLTLLLSRAALAASGPVAGAVIAISGSPEVRSKGKPAFRPLKPNQFVYEADLLKASAGERIFVSLIGGAEVSIDENSEFEVGSGGGNGKPAALKSTMGHLCTRLLHGLSGVRIKTPLGVVAVRGTEAEVDLENPAELIVRVFEGHVDLLSADETTTLAKLQANQETVFRGGAAKPRVSSIDPSYKDSCFTGVPPPTGLKPSVQGTPPPPSSGPRAALVEGYPGYRRGKVLQATVLAQGEVLQTGDVLVSAPGQFVRLDFPYGAAVAIHDEARLELESVEAGGPSKTVSLKSGQAWLMAPAGGRLDCVTPMGKLRLDSGEADLNLAEGLRLKVYAGEAVLDSPRGRVVLHAGQGTQLSANGSAPRPPATLTPADRETWQKR